MFIVARFHQFFYHSAYKHPKRYDMRGQGEFNLVNPVLTTQTRYQYNKYCKDVASPVMTMAAYLDDSTKRRCSQARSRWQLVERLDNQKPHDDEAANPTRSE